MLPILAAPTAIAISRHLLLFSPTPWETSLFSIQELSIFSLCLCTSTKNSERVVMAGAAAALIKHLPEANKLDGAESLATLELLCKTLAGRTTVGGHALSVPALVRMVLKVSDQATECATDKLLAICSSLWTVHEAAVQAGVFTQMLLLIQSDCTKRAKKKSHEIS
ncbi:hypothetical protein O6H91_17G054500 [Diphasiastrum complanatum]|uniref:Uncharacterized protein n=1 Tax=Diphasiastrum complanatum TaxID=34168 RepID=A0ACC2B6Z8_DIPCM|nr:hypothetical protein O6H91_17G054500 [Diphasiastrum complanatum]